MHPTSERVSVFVPLTKFDETTGAFEGVLAEEAVDRSGEIFDYATSKPFFENWSSGFQKATKGKSAGNLRAMHSKVAAGKFTSVTFDDEAKKILVVGKVIDGAEKTKMAEGVYTGLSIGGKYVKRWKDGEDSSVQRYTADPYEGSLVDLPCMYGAQFTAVKADGVEEIRKFRGPRQVWECAFTEKHAHAAKAEALACREEVAKSDMQKLALPILEKGMYSIGDLACAIACLNSIRVSSKYEAEYEGDASPVPAAMASIVEQCIEVLRQMVDEEGAELLADIESGTLEMWTHGGIDKLLARIPAEEMQKALDLLERTKTHVQTLAEKAGPEDEMDEKVLKGILEESGKAQREAFEKSFGDRFEEFSKGIKAEFAEAGKKTGEAIAKLTADLEEVKKATPEAPKVAVRPVEKEADEPGKQPETKDTSKDAAFKAAFRRPIAMDPRVTGSLLPNTGSSRR